MDDKYKKGFVVEIKEVLVRKIFIRAEDEQEALNIAQTRYENEEEVLGAEDFVSIDFNLIKQENN